MAEQTGEERNEKEIMDGGMYVVSPDYKALFQLC